jgi:hypothetical protein
LKVAADPPTLHVQARPSPTGRRSDAVLILQGFPTPGFYLVT